jgi:hypothetical protein
MDGEGKDLQQQGKQHPEPAAPKKKIVRKSFMGEKCSDNDCLREFKVEKDYDDYKLTCPYCAKAVKSTRILIEQVSAKKR